MVSPPDGGLTHEDRVVLASSRRQLVLYHLHEHGGPLSLDELSRRVAASETDGEADQSDHVVERVAHSLDRTHLPVLVAYGVVLYDEEEETIRPTDRLEEHLDALRTEGDGSRFRRWPWGLYYVIPAVVLASAVLAIEYGVVRRTDAALLWVTFVGVLALLLVALSHYVVAHPRE